MTAFRLVLSQFTARRPTLPRNATNRPWFGVWSACAIVGCRDQRTMQGADVRSVQLHLLGELASTVSTIQRIHLNSSIHETLIPLFQSTKLFRNLSSFSLNLYPWYALVFVFVSFGHHLASSPLRCTWNYCNSSSPHLLYYYSSKVQRMDIHNVSWLRDVFGAFEALAYIMFSL